MAALKTFVGFSCAAIALATPLASRVVHNVELDNRQMSSDACAQVSVAAEAQAAATPTVAASLAYDCITSVPFNQSAALALVDGVKPYFKWQSNTAWLKDPPEEYATKVQGPVDIWGELEEIRSKVVANEYKNEFEFGWELYVLLQSTHDGHFVYIPDVIGTVFNWARPVPLVSVSSDGQELPQPYVYADVLAETLGNATFKPSPVTKINDQDAQEFLENWAQYGSLQDRDALYNNVFYELATVSLGPVGSGIGTFAGSGRGRWVYPGKDTKLDFANGTTKTYPNYAKVLADFEGISSGEDVYKKFFSGRRIEEPEIPANTSTPLPSGTPTPTPEPKPSPIPAPGYPPPVIREVANLIGGYYMEDDYSDIAVLSVPSFSATDGAEVSFQQVAERFLAMAKAAGKKKLIVDVSANGGGIILQGYDLYKQLFPQGVDHAAADRFRAHEAVDIMGQKFSNISEGLPRVYIEPEENETLWQLEYDVVSSLLNYQTDVDVDGKNFESWEDKYGPVEVYGDEFSNLFRWNLSDVLTPFNSGGIYIHGYGNLTNFTQPFAAEDIVVVTDGYCASTCTIFSELMRQRAGVRYISLGGRPREGLTQAIGGVKGTNNWPWTYIQALAQYTITNLSSTDEGAYYNTTELGEYWDEVVFDRQAVGSSINVNFRDGIRDSDLAEGDESETPLQFVYEESDCRILYTKPMTVDVTSIWKAVANSAWDGYGESSCIAGNLGNGHYKRNVRRELSPRDKVLSSRMHQWRRGLKASDYPLDVFTDLSKARKDDDGIMWP